MLNASNMSYRIQWYSVSLQWWQSPSDEVDNYLVTLYQGEHVVNISFINSTEYDIFKLNYTTHYSIHISAINCAGIGEPLLQNLLEG